MQINREHFKISLAAAGTTIDGFAHEYGVSDAYIHMILRGKRASKDQRLEKAMQRLIDIQFERLRFVKQFKAAA
jgi:hypothetical protein